jgi:GT2 family glycosyltransferase
MKIGIIIPVHNNLDLTKEAVDSIKTVHPFQIYIIDDHSNQDMKDWLNSRPDIIKIIDPEGSTGLSYNWNSGIRLALADGCTHILVANNDVLFNPATIDRLVERIDVGDVVMVTGTNINNGQDPKEILNADPDQYGVGESPHPDFSCFMIKPDTLEKIGWFDENFLTAYFEDNDYHARIVLSGNTAIKLHNAPYFHYGAKTINNATAEKQKTIQEHFSNNAIYFIQKWGVYAVSDPEKFAEQYFPTPFNDSNKTIKEW